jgi:hypothetical protein
MKNEQARALPSFSPGPHSKQEDVSRILQILASVCNAPAAAVTNTTAARFLCSVEKIKHQMTLGGIFEEEKNKTVHRARNILEYSRRSC